MKQTPNINLPILEQGDKYLKETQNEAFSVIDREIAGLNSAISVLDNVEGSIIDTKSDVETLKNETNTLKASLNDMASNVIPNIQTSLDNIETQVNGLNQLNNKFNGVNFFIGDVGSNYNLSQLTNIADEILKTNIKDLFLVIYQNYDTNNNSLTLSNDIMLIQQVKDMLIQKGFNIIGYKFHVSNKVGLPINNTTWFEQYENNILSVIDTIGNAGVTYCNLYNEFTDIASNENFKNLFISLNEKIKNRNFKTFHTNTITGAYSSKVLDIVDMIGVNMYPSVSDKGKHTTLEECIKAWYFSFDGAIESQKMIKSIKKRFNVPVVISEVGMPPVEEAFLNPEKYDYDLTNIDYNHQALFLEGFFEAYKDFEFEGFFIWNSTSRMFSPFKDETTINLINKYI